MRASDTLDRNTWILMALAFGALGILQIQWGRQKCREEVAQGMSELKRAGLFSGKAFLLRGWIFLIGAIVFAIQAVLP